MQNVLDAIRKFPAGKLLGQLLLGFFGGAATAYKLNPNPRTAVGVGVASAITSGVAFFVTPAKSEAALRTTDAAP